MQLPPVLNPLDRPVVLFILLALLSVFEPVLVLLAVGHGCTFEGIGCSNLLISPSVGLAQVGPPQVGTAQVGPVQVGIAQAGLPQVGLPQVGTGQVGLPQVGTVQVGTAQVDIAKVGSAKLNDGSTFAYSVYQSCFQQELHDLVLMACVHPPKHRQRPRPR